MADLTPEKAREELLARASRIGRRDLERLLKSWQKLQKSVYGPLASRMDDVKLLFSLVRDFYRGDYRDIPWRSVAAVVATLLYIMNPFDLIPDFLPGIGKVDDLMVLTACLSLIRSDIERYRQWREANRSPLSPQGRA